MSHPADQLIAAWLVDDLDAEGVRALETHLRRDPAVRARFARFCQSETVLSQALAEAPVRPGTTAIRPALRVGTRRMRVRSPSGRLVWVLPLAAAAALIAVIIAFGVLRPAPEPIPPLATTGPLELRALLDQGEVLVDGRPLRAGEFAPRGAEVQVARGLAEFHWTDGTVLTAQAPGHARVVAEASALDVRQGRWEARVTKRDAVPFRLDSPHASVVVMGTRFSLHVEQDATTVAVMEGRVRLETSAATSEVVAGETVTADGGGVKSDGVAAVLGFVPTAYDVRTVLGPRQVRRTTLRLSDLAQGFNLRIDCSPAVKSVQTHMRGESQPRLEVSKFFVFGNFDNTAIKEWKPRVGTFIVEAQAFADRDGTEPVGSLVEFELTIVP